MSSRLLIVCGSTALPRRAALVCLLLYGLLSWAGVASGQVDSAITTSVWQMKYNVLDAQVNQVAPYANWLNKDDDGDGITNGQELVAGTNPFFKTAGQPHFKIASSTLSGSNLVLTIPTVSGKLYQVVGKAHLTDAAWSSTGLPSVVGDGTTKTLNVPQSAGSFFCVTVGDQASQNDNVGDWAKQQLGFSTSAPIASQSSFTHTTLAAQLLAQNVVTLAATDDSTTQPASAGAAPSDFGIITVSRSGHMLLNSITVPLTASGTAVAGVDYVALPSSITFPAGVSSLDIQITPLYNASRMSTGTVTLTAGAAGSSSSAAGNYSLGTPAAASVTIYPSGNPVGTGLLGNFFAGSNATYSSTANFAGSVTNYIYTKTSSTAGVAVINSPVVTPPVAPYSANSQINLQFTSGPLAVSTYNSIYTVVSNTASTFTVNISGTNLPASGTGSSTHNLVRLDSTVDYIWGAGIPATTALPTAASNNWAAQFNGYLNVPSTGSYDFDVQADDGARVYVNGTLVVDAWTPGSSTYTPLASSTPVALTAGTPVLLHVEYYNLNGSDSIALRYKLHSSGSMAAIPAANVFTDTTMATPGWVGTYWANTSFIGQPSYGDFPAQLTLNWGTSQPSATLPATTNYAVRWEGYFQPASTGAYAFSIQATDGARVYLDTNQNGSFDGGETLIDGWAAGSSGTTALQSSAVTLTAGQRYKMRVDYYYQGTGSDSAITLLYKLGTGSFASLPVSSVYRDTTSTITGWWSSYYANTTLTGLPLYCVQDLSTNSVTYNFGTSSTGKPATANPGSSSTTNWAAVWQGYLNPSATGNFTFTMTADDGARVYLNGNLVIDAWSGSSGVAVTSAAVALTQGNAVPIRVEYNQLTAKASAILQWTPPSGTKATIPAANFFQDATLKTPGLTGSYWTNTGMIGSQSYYDYPTQINFNYGSGQPSYAWQVTQWSGTWDGYLSPTATGSYLFDVRAMDQARVYINGALVIDAWSTPDSAAVNPIQSAAINLTAGTRVPIHIDYANTGGSNPLLILRWQPPTSSSLAAIPSTSVFRDSTTSQQGLLATYYSNTTLTAPYVYAVAENPSSTLTYTFGPGRPDPALPFDNFTVRWTGQVLPQYSEPYYFTVKSDDGARLWVNGQLLVDKWQSQGTTENIGTPITLQAGVPYDIKLEYLELSSNAECHLNWYCNDQAEQIIPSNRLFPTMTGMLGRAGDLAAAPPVITSPTENVTLMSAGTPFSLTLTSSNGGGSYSATGLPSWLTLNNGVLSGTPPVAGIYQFTVTTTNGAGTGSSVVTVNVKSTGSQVTRDLFTSGVAGANISDVPWTATPSTTDTALTSLEDAKTTYAANTGERLRGYFTVPTSGCYYFWLASSNVAELWISDNAEPCNKVKRAYVTGTTGTASRTWNTQANQQSAWLNLVAGQQYYYEVLHNTGASGAANNLAVAWYLDPTGNSSSVANGAGPGAPATGGIVPNYVLSPWNNPATTTVSGSIFATNLQGADGLSNIKGTGSAYLRVNGSSAVLHLNYSGLTSGVTFQRIYTVVNGGSPTLLFDLGAQIAFYPTLQTGDGGYTWNMQASDLTNLQSGNVFISIGTVNNPGGELAGTFGAVSGSQVAPAPPTYSSWTDDHSSVAGAARFLTQATYGPSPSDIAYVQANGYRAWIENQFTQSATHCLPYVFANLSNDPQNPYTDTTFFNAWWKNSITGSDQLRQRMAFALSEIMVASDTGVLNNNGRALASYYDALLDNAFGSYHDLLKAVTLTPAMGLYLDMLENAKGNMQTGLHADENYAREVMQLFSVGLFRLWPDGTVVLDSTGNPASSYDQTVVTGMAQVFTGWSYGQVLQSGGRLPTSLYPSSNYLDPMVLVPTYHDLNPKQLLDNVVLPAATVISSSDVTTSSTPVYSIQSMGASGPGSPVTSTVTNNYDRNGLRDLEAALNSLVVNQSVAPYICRQLIQRLVTSTPSPAYVYRVTRAFNGQQNVDGVATGVIGDMKEVIRAVLLDSEARSATAAASNTFGKQREPLLRVTAPARAFPPTSIPGCTYRESGAQALMVQTPTPHHLVSGDWVMLDNFVDGSSNSGNTPSTLIGGYQVTASPTYNAVAGTAVTINAGGFQAGDSVYVQFTSGVLNTSPYNTAAKYSVTSATPTTFTITIGSSMTGSGGNVLLPNNFTVNNAGLVAPSYTINYTYTGAASGNTLTISALGYSVGNSVPLKFTSGTLAGAGYDGTYAVTAVTSTNFTISLTKTPPANSTGVCLINNTNTVSIGTTGPIVGHPLYLKFSSGSLADGAHDGVYTVAATTTGNFTVNLAATPPGTTGGTCLYPRFAGGYVVTNSGNTSTVSFQTTGNHNLSVGQNVWIDVLVGLSPNALPSGNYQIASVPAGNIFTVTVSPAITAGSQSTSGAATYPQAIGSWTRSGTCNLDLGSWNMGASQSDIIQTPLDSASVFNFFRPGYAYPGAIAKAGMTTPEFQLTNDSNTMNLTNLLSAALLNGSNTYGYVSVRSANGTLVMDLSPYMTSSLTSDAGIPTLVDNLSAVLTGGSLQSATRTNIINFVSGSVNFPTTSATYMRDRVRAVVHLIITSAEYAIQK